MLAITSGDVSGLGALAMASSVNLTTQATGTMQAAQEPAHSGDVTNTAGSLALTIAAAAVTNAKLATMAATTLKGNNTGATAAPVDLTAAQVKTMLAITSGDVSGLGALATASSVNLTTQATGTLQAAQHPAHTGDVTNAAGALALTITANVVDNTKLAQVATARFKGRTTAGTGNVEDLTGTQATALLDTVTSAAKGLAPASGGGTVNFLRADGNWAAPPAGGSGVFSDTVFTLQDNVDATKQALFELGGLTTATTRTYTLPDVTTTLVGLAGTQTMTGDKTLNGVVTLGLPLVMTAQASDPGSPADGWVWYNATSQQLKARTGGSVRIIDSQQDIGWLTPVSGEFMMTTMGAGAATGTLAGAAARVDMFPFTARADNALTGLTLNCTTAVASALGKIAVYDSDANGRPNALITETADLDLSTVGTKTATVTLTLRQGRTYWFGVRHSSTATISTWATNATPDINGGSTIATTTRKVLRRTLTYATAAPASWVFASAEINTAAAPAVWLKV